MEYRDDSFDRLACRRVPFSSGNNLMWISDFAATSSTDIPRATSISKVRRCLIMSSTAQFFRAIKALSCEGKLDIAFIDNGDVFSKNYPISVQTVQREEFVLISSSEFYLENIKGGHSLQKLKSLPFVDYLSHAQVARMWFKHHFGKSIIELKVNYSAERDRKSVV